MVPEAGLEPARPNGQGILNPSCLPIPPPGQIRYKIDGAGDGIRTRDPNLGKVVLYP